MNDLISRQAAIDALEESKARYFDRRVIIGKMQDIINSLPSAQPEWIPFELRSLDDEEKEEHPDWDFILTGKLPDDGQRILVNCVWRNHEDVQMDEFYQDCDGSYLDSGYEIGTEVTHWMPLPEPPKDGE